MGLNLENCEQWLERAVLAFVAFMVVIIVIRVRFTSPALSIPLTSPLPLLQLHFLLAVSNLYSQLIRRQFAVTHTRSHSHFIYEDSNTPRKIYLLPNQQATQDSDVELVYAPVPISSLPENIRSSAKEAWVTQGSPRSERGRHSRTTSDVSHIHYSCEQQQEQQQQRVRMHHRRHSHSHGQHGHQSSRSASSTRTGKIRLPILPDEGLLPSYYGDEGVKV